MLLLRLVLPLQTIFQKHGQSMQIGGTISWLPVLCAGLEITLKSCRPFSQPIIRPAANRIKVIVVIEYQCNIGRPFKLKIPKLATQRLLNARQFAAI